MPTDIRLGIVTGLVFEATILAKAARRVDVEDLWIVPAGLGAGRATAAAERLIAAGATHLMSFGVAAGLDPALRSGTAVVARAVQGSRGAPIVCDTSWADRLLAGLPGAIPGVVADCPEVLETGAAKAALRSLTAASIGDMESYDVATAAAQAQVPCAIVRVVGDRATQAIPSVALAGADDEGRVRKAVVGAALRTPAQWGGLIRLALATSAAKSRLKILADLGLPWLFFAELGDE